MDVVCFDLLIFSCDIFGIFVVIYKLKNSLCMFIMLYVIIACSYEQDIYILLCINEILLTSTSCLELEFIYFSHPKSRKKNVALSFLFSFP